MQIAVTTPTGNTGRELVPMLVRAGVRPRVLVRDPDRLDPTFRDHVEPVVTDLRDADAVAAATVGVDALFWVAPSPMTDDPVAGYAALGAVAAHAVTANAIPRTVFQSSVGAERRHGVGEIDGLARIEEQLDATGATVLHLRCGYFFTNLAMQLDTLRGGVVPIVLPVDAPMPWVAPRDVAEVAASRLLSAAWSGRQVQAVHGPEDLSWAQACAVVTEATGTPVRAERIGSVTTRCAPSWRGPAWARRRSSRSWACRPGSATTSSPSSHGRWPAPPRLRCGPGRTTCSARC